MIPLLITGALGRMGKTLVQESLQFPELQIAGGTEYPGMPDLGKDLGELCGLARLNLPLSESLSEIFSKIDFKKKKPVVIDFTQPAPTLAHVKILREKGFPLVIGTTGFSDAERKKLEEAAKDIPIVFSPNMSVGVNLLFNLVAEAAKVLGEDYDIEIFEAHHKLKKDAPSGTAVQLARVLAEATGRNYPKDFNFHREGVTGERNPKEIGMQVLRGGDIVGEHTVFYCGEGERVEIKHVATSRKTFARGALRAAIWASKQKPGLYSMKDVLKL